MRRAPRPDALGTRGCGLRATCRILAGERFLRRHQRQAIQDQDLPTRPDQEVGLKAGSRHQRSPVNCP